MASSLHQTPRTWFNGEHRGILGWWLDLMILNAFSSLNDCMILRFDVLFTLPYFCLSTSHCQKQEHVTYLLSTGFSSLTGMTFTEMVLRTLCFPSDSWILKPSVRFSELSCTYISFIPMWGRKGEKNKREREGEGERERQMERTTSSDSCKISHIISLCFNHLSSISPRHMIG